MSTAPRKREDVGPRYFGPAMWIYAICLAGAFIALPPYASTGGGWTRRVVFAIVFGIGGGLVDVWSDRRHERRLLAQVDSEPEAIPGDRRDRPHPPA